MVRSSAAEMAHAGGLPSAWGRAHDLDERYTGPAREFGGLVGERGHTLEWGGSDTGLMKAVADAVRGSGGRLVGIRPAFAGSGPDRTPTRW